MRTPVDEMQNPMILADLGTEWSNQPEEGYSGDEFWAGGEGVAVDDLNGDGLLDIFVPTWDQNCCFQQLDGSFEEQSEMNSLPVDEPVRTVGAVLLILMAMMT